MFQYNIIREVNKELHMPPTFSSTSFSFEKGENIPEHIEEYPALVGDSDKYHLQGYDSFDGGRYPLAINIDDIATANILRNARLRQLEISQPSSSSGGQNGIQDRVILLSPIN